MLAPFATTALADSDLPPPQYDIGGVTEADTLVAYIDRFGTDAPPLHRVAFGEALALCDRISLARFGSPYPAAEGAAAGGEGALPEIQIHGSRRSRQGAPSKYR